MRDDIKCPYCEVGQDINHDDGYGFEEDYLHQQECGNCGKTFTFTTYISYSYTPYKADCLNGGKHIYKPTITVPRQYTKMQCIMCDDERLPTGEEMKLILAK